MSGEPDTGQSQGGGAQAPFLTPNEQVSLLTTARQALEAHVRGEAPSIPAAGGGLDAPCGAFVSLHRQGELRGCLGRIESRAPLAETVARLAEAVADSDTRFDPVRRDELEELDLEVSVLTPPHEIRPEEIEVGRHGLIVERDRHTGLLLPQVASERNWSVTTFLEQTCLKAGLPPDAWQRGARVLAFEALVIGEHAGDRQ